MTSLLGRACAAAGLVLGLAAAPAWAAEYPQVDPLRLDQVRIEGSHNSYRPFPSPAEQQRIQSLAPQYWAGLDYGHPPLESQLALGVRQLEIDVSPDAKGGAYAAPYADAPPRAKALMAAPGAKVLHVPGFDTETHCLTFRTCLEIFARWSDAHPDHAPVVILVNSVDPMRIPTLFPYDLKFDQPGIDALNTDIAEVIGRARVVTPDDVRGAHASLRDAVLAKAWPTVERMRGKILFVLDGNDAHERFLKTGHPSLKGRMMFGWFAEGDPEAAFFNIQEPDREFDRIRRLTGQGFIVRTRGDADTKEARTRDGRRMEKALASGAQLVSTDYYPGVPDPEAFGYTADFGGAKVRCNEVLTTCGAPAR